MNYTASNSTTVALIGVFTALYIVAAGVAGAALSPFAHGYPEHLIRGFLMTGLVIRTRRMWSATMMGLASGIVFVLVVPSPAPYLLASTFVSGLVFDLVLGLGRKYSSSISSLTKILVGSGISGIAESISALAFLTYFGVFTTYASPLQIIWGTDISVNIVLSLVGAYLAFRFLSKRIPASMARSNVPQRN
ncbi:MAG: hypothetical protein ACYC9U_04170 [Nitrososphaerales archaeon]